MGDTAIFAISLAVTVLGLVISWGLYRRKGAASALRGASWSLVPVAAAMTGVTEFLVDLALSPGKWAGIGVAGLAVVLYLTSGAMLSRRPGGEERQKPVKPGRGERKTGGKGREVEAPKGAADTGLDAEIAKILRDRGIS